MFFGAFMPVLHEAIAVDRRIAVLNGHTGAHAPHLSRTMFDIFVGYHLADHENATEMSFEVHEIERRLLALGVPFQNLSKQHWEINEKTKLGSIL